MSKIPVTKVRIRLTEPAIRRNDKLLAFVSITLGDAIVIHDFKIIDGTKGPFMASPTRKIADRCPDCRSKNSLSARFCNECGNQLPLGRVSEGVELYANIAHPVSTGARRSLETVVMRAFEEESRLLTEPDYQYEWRDYRYGERQ